jgi:DNA-entry nuclease
MKNIFKRGTLALLALLLALCLAFVGCEEEKDFDKELEDLIINSTEKSTKPAQSDSEEDNSNDQVNADTEQKDPMCDILGIPQYSGKPFAAVNGNEPTFTKDEITTKSYEFFSDLDHLGRCGYVMACVGKDLMPTEDRGDIGHIKPTGWVQGKYDSSLVSGGNLYNRCHLIGFQLTGENDNDKNLITGTRYMNWDGMVEFENMIADYVKETGNHVMYRVTPMFHENELVARGVHMEAYSVEDDGEGISFNVYAYNVQPGIVIDYATGKNWLSTDPRPEEENKDNENNVENEGEAKYILNTNSKKVHLSSCSSAAQTSENNKQEYNGTLDDILAQGYTKCGICKP